MRNGILQAQYECQQLKLKYQEELIQNKIIVREKERKHIAEYLHDMIGTKLNVINLNLHQLKSTDRATDKIKRVGYRHGGDTEAVHSGVAQYCP